MTGGDAEERSRPDGPLFFFFQTRGYTPIALWMHDVGIKPIKGPDLSILRSRKKNNSVASRHANADCAVPLRASSNAHSDTQTRISLIICIVTTPSSASNTRFFLPLETLKSATSNSITQL